MSMWRKRSGTIDWDGVYAVVIIAGAVTLIAGLIGYCIWFTIKYKCVESESYRCTTTTCRMHDDHENCIMWVSEEDTCTRCIRYEERK